jgi:hypothetical protein
VPPAQLQREQREHEHRDHAGADERGRVLRQHPPLFEADLGHGDDEREGGRGRQHQRQPVVPRDRPAVEEQHGRPTNDEEQREEERQAELAGQTGEPGCLQDACDRECERKREQPAPHREPRRLPADLKKVDLHPGEEEEEREPRGTEERDDLTGRDEVEHVRPDDDPGQDLDDDDRRSSTAAIMASVSLAPPRQSSCSPRSRPE